MLTESLDNPLYCGLAVLFTLLFLLSLRSFLKVAPSLWDCVARWKGNLNLEESVQLSRSRNWVAATLFIPFCMVVHTHDLYSPDFLQYLTPPLRLAAVIGVFVIYLLLRTFLNWQLEMHNYGSAVFTAANRSFYNYCVILFFLLFLSGALINVFSGDKSLARSVLLWETGVTYLIYIYRRGQIFSSSCNPFGLWY